MASDTKDGFNRNKLGAAFRVIKVLSSVPAPGVNKFLKVDTTIVMGQEGSREQLAEYFEEQHNIPLPVERLAGGANVPWWL